ncbi:MAG: YciI family protein [Demequina sp.]
MSKYLISFPSSAMMLADEALEAASVDSHAVIEEAKAAGVYVFGGGIDEGFRPVRVDADGAVSDGLHAGSNLTGGFLVLELPTREEALDWARKVAAACRCPQELRAFGYDPAS